jgi:glycosyltransferase involved in cell wall biosynthesis
MKILILLPLNESGGGSHVLVSEALALQDLGLSVTLLNFQHHETAFTACYPDLNLPVRYISGAEAVADTALEYDWVVATVYFTVEWLASLQHHPQAPQIAYYIQDFEPYFFVDKPARQGIFWAFPWLRRRLASYYFRYHPEFRKAWLSYQILPNMLLLTKTAWNQRELKYQTGRDAHIVGASYQSQIFYPRRAVHTRQRLNIMAMIRPNTPRRAAALTLHILKKIQQEYGEVLDIFTFGCAQKDYQHIEGDFPHTALGELNSNALADSLQSIDIFVDFSYFQAMGLTAMEAMACGVAVIVPITGGTDSFAQHGYNALCVNSHRPRICYQAMQQLINDTPLRQRLAQQAAADMPQFTPKNAAKRWLALMKTHITTGKIKWVG